MISGENVAPVEGLLVARIAGLLVCSISIRRVYILLEYTYIIITIL